MSDLVLTAGIAFLLIGVVCLVAGLAGYLKAEVTWFPPDPDPVDAHHATLPDLRPWLPADVDPRDEMTGEQAQAILRRLAAEFADDVEHAIDQGHADYDLYRRRQHLPGEHHYPKERSQ